MYWKGQEWYEVALCLLKGRCAFLEITRGSPIGGGGWYLRSFLGLIWLNHKPIPYITLF